jgi:lysophospholipase L1-like esterase
VHQLQHPSRSRGTLLANLALAVGSLIFFLVTLELLSRAVGFQRRGSWTVRCYEHVADVGHLLEPGCETAMYKGISTDWSNVPVHANSHGLRGPEFPEAKPPGTRRVLVLGDSVAFGYLLPEEQSMPALLERRLADHGLGPVRVINSAMPGNGIRNEREYFEHRGLAFAPDTVVLVAAPGDIIDSGIRKDQSDTHRPGMLRQRYRLFRFVQRRSSLAVFMQFAFWETLQYLDPTLSLRSGMSAETLSPALQNAWDRYEEEFVRLASLARDHHVDLVLVVYPGMVELYADRDTTRDRWRALAARDHVPMVDLLPTFRRERDRGLYIAADAHPNGTANAIVASALADWIGARWRAAVPPE